MTSDALLPGEAEHELYERLIDFSDRFYKAVAETADGNVVVSPSGFAAVVHLLSIGARTDTRQELVDVLLGSEYAEELSPLLDTLFAVAEEGPLKLAKSAWTAQKFAIEPGYLHRTGGDVKSVDFADGQGAAKRINQWASDHTAGVIDKIVSAGDFDGNTVLALLSAVYLLGKWQSPFDPDKTRDAPFWVKPEQPEPVPMMRQQFREIEHGRIEGAEVVRLPFHDGFAMMFIVPDERAGLAAVRLRPNLLPEALAACVDVSKAALRLPRFKFSYDTRLEEICAKLGIEKAFDPFEANFKDIADLPTGLYVSVMRQSVSIEVDEAGAEAAAVTVAVATTRSMSSPKMLNIRLDRPFIFMIQHEESGLIHFIGEVKDPTKE